MTVVLDTNVLLSLYVFADSRFALLRELIDSGRWLAVTNEACIAEFVRVLSYPIFALDASQQSAALERYSKFVGYITTPNRSVHAIQLPRCTDADDQKFLELARDSGAMWLVTSDRALLKLARRLARAGMFRIVTPEFALKEMQMGLSVAVAQ